MNRFFLIISNPPFFHPLFRFPLAPQSLEMPPEVNMAVHEGDFHATSVSSLVHFPLTIATSLMPSGEHKL